MNSQKQKQLEQILKVNIIQTEQLKGGSGDEVYLLHTEKQKYVYKTGLVESIAPQLVFYKHYPSLSYLPKLVYSADNASEFVIVYLEAMRSNDYDKEAIVLDLLKNFIAKYTIVEADDYGFVSEFITGKTFADFLRKQAFAAYTYTQDIFSGKDLTKVLATISKVYEAETFAQKYLLHADLGFHNLFYNQNELLGVIDPDPIVGHPVYDLLYAYCSTPEQITLSGIQKCLGQFSEYFPINLDYATEYLAIALFKRISSCTKHHPEDLPEYLRVWGELVAGKI